MNISARALLLLATLGLLSACQQAVRPNLVANAPVQAAVPAAAPIVAEPGPAIAESPQQAPVETATEAAKPTVIAPAISRGADVFARINNSLSPQACSVDEGNKRWRQRYAKDPAAFAGHLEQILPLLDFVSAEVERAGLPAEFVFIPLVESWYRPDAIGINGPSGMWQMISSTARNHGVHIQPGYDGRLSPVESTRAALSYLKTLQDMFGDWQAIVMAYNAGEGRMMGAFRRSQNRNVSAAKRTPHGLSNITYDYVSRLQALSCLVAEPGRHGLTLPLSAQFVPLAPVLMDAGISSLDEFAAIQGQDPIEIRRLNPGYKGGRIVAGVPRLVLIPFALKQAEVQAPPTTAMTMAVSPRGDTPDSRKLEP